MKRLFVLWCHWWSELSPNRNKGRVIWLRSLGSCHGFEKAACHGSRYIDNHTQLYQNLGWARYLIQYWGQMITKLAQFKMFCCVSWEKWKIGKKPHANFVKHMQTNFKPVTNPIIIESLFSFWVELWRTEDFMTVSQCCFNIYLWCQGFFFGKNSALSLLLNVFPHVENWEIDWKAELPLFWLSEEMKQKQTGHGASRSVLESRHKDS